MQVKLDTKALSERLKQLLAVVDTKSAISAFQHVLLTVGNGLATFQAYNPQIGMFSGVVKAEGDAGSLLLPAKRLSEIATNFQADTVVFNADSEVDAEGSSNVTVKCGKYKAALRARPASEFKLTLETPEAVTATLPRAGFLDLIEKVAFVVPSNAGKFTVPVALLDFKEDRVLLVGTDGWRLAVAAIVAEFRTAEGVVPTSLNIPKTALSLLHLLTGATFTISETENALFFQTETEVFAASKVTGTFPPYARIIPTTKPATTITSNRDVLAYAIGRAKPVADDETPVISFDVTPTEGEVSPLLIRSTSKAAGMANDVVEVKATGAPQEFFLNAEYLMPFVEKAGEEIRTEITNPKAVIAFHSGPTYQFYIMPSAVMA